MFEFKVTHSQADMSIYLSMDKLKRCQVKTVSKTGNGEGQAGGDNVLAHGPQDQDHP